MITYFWRQKVAMKIAWLLPHSVVYWCAIRVWAHATTGRYGSELATAVTFDRALDRWGDLGKPKSNVGGHDCASGCVPPRA